MDAPREIPIHPSVLRSRTFFGGDRELGIFLALISAILVFALMTWWSIFLGIALWLAGVGVLSLLEKIDPLLRPVYLRHVKYGTYYPAKASIYSFGVRLPRRWR